MNPTPPERSNPEQSPGPSLLRGALELARFCFAVSARGTLLTIAVSAAGSLAEGFGLLMLLPLLASAGMNFGGTSGAGRLTAFAQRLLTASALPQQLWLPVILGAFLVAAATRSTLRRVHSTLLYTTTNTVQLTLSRRVYAAVVHANWTFLVRQRGGSFTHVLTDQLGKVAEAVALMLTLINLILIAVLYLAIALRLSAAITLLVLAMGAALMLLQQRSLARTRQSGSALTRSIGEVYTATEEHLANLKSVKTYDAEERAIESFSELCATVVRNSISTAKLQATAAFQFEVGSLVALAAIILVAFALFHVQGATMLLLLGVFSRLMPQLAGVQAQAHQFAATLPAYEDLLHLEADCAAHAEPVFAASVKAPQPLRLTRELRLEDIWFRYPSGASGLNPDVLRGMEITIKAGLITALTGPSGSGKSTLADIVTGLLSPTRGRMVLDGRELAAADLRAWRNRIGYVGQDTLLFHQSIRDNLLWACPAATDEDVDRALRLAAAGFVYDLPRGLDSIAGDRGILLSSGQRQRLSLARALLRRPSLLVLDEATNALDIENEARILDALLNAMQTLHGELTILMVAHRPSALSRAHRVFELEDGLLAESGTSGRAGKL